MSWTCECTESNKFKVKNPNEVKEVLSDVGFDVYENEEGLCFFGDEGTYLDSDIEVVLSLKPVTLNDEVKNYLGIDNPQSCDNDFADNMESLNLEDEDVMRTPIYEYLQDQLEEGSHILITNAGYDERTSGKFSPFGGIEIITKNATDGYSLNYLEDKLINKYIKKEGE